MDDFQESLLRYSQEPRQADRDSIERELWQRYGETITVLIVDMSGYSRRVREHGLVHYLSMIRRLQLTVEPIVENCGGSIFKFEADNADARFESPVQAIRASVALNMALDSANILTPEELDVHVSCGIDHGECLVRDASHIHGYPVIRASKLGEDLGKPGQILITQEAMKLVPDSCGLSNDIVTVPMAGEQVQVHSICYRTAAR